MTGCFGHRNFIPVSLHPVLSKIDCIETMTISFGVDDDGNVPAPVDATQIATRAPAATEFRSRGMDTSERQDPNCLADAGWGVLFARGIAPGIKEKLGRLLDLRKKQVGARPLYHEFENYAKWVAEYEDPARPVPTSREIAFFGIRSPDDDATALLMNQLVKPLAHGTERRRPVGHLENYGVSEFLERTPERSAYKKD